MTDPRGASEFERVLFVHAHPDDETLATGGTMATLVQRGAAVTLLTCTRGERGEVIPDDLKYALASPETLAAVREVELRKAVAILGVTDHRFLGDADARWDGRPPRRYVDSGMRWGKRGAEATDEFDPASLTAADFGDIAADVAAVILELRPDAVVSYDDQGGYGHPDHVRTHQAARRAAEVYGVPFFAIGSSSSGTSGAGADIAVDVSPVFERKRRALEAYRSQVVVTGDTYALADGASHPIDRIERFSRVSDDAERPVRFVDQPWAGRVFVSVLAAAVGAAAGALLSVYNQTTLPVGHADIWLGSIVGVVLVAALLIGFRLAFATRIVAFWCAVAMILLVGLFTLQSAGGTVLIPTIGSDGSWNGAGVLWAITPAVVAFVVLVWPRSRRRAPGRIAKQPEVKGP